MYAPSPIFLEPQWFFPLFAAMWFGIGGLLAYLAGWPRLAERFRATQPVDGERFRFASGSIGAATWFPVNYRSCLFFTIGKTGFSVSVFFPFRFLSPPLFIPWAQVESVAEQRSWFDHHVVIRIRGTSTRIMVRGRASQGITQAYGRYSSQT